MTDAIYAEKEPASFMPAGLDVRALRDWLSCRVEGVDEGLRAQRIGSGQSNPSWLLRGARHAWVLRAKPAPARELLPSAHAIEREFRMLQALQGSEVPVPRVRVLCEDESVIGVAFYVMDYVEGRVFQDATLAHIHPVDRKAYFAEANRVLAQLHCVDWRELGLHDFGRHEGYYSRLIRRWSAQYEASKVNPIEAMERLKDWLPAHIPSGADGADLTCITHGDYRMENLMFHPERPEIVAVLDWELCTLGHPLSDLSYNALAWHMPSGILRGFGDQNLADLGLPSEKDYVAWYVQAMGLDETKVSQDWSFYLAFNLFRLSAILQGIGHREREGIASNASAKEISVMADSVAQRGWDIAQRQ